MQAWTPLRWTSYFGCLFFAVGLLLTLWRPGWAEEMAQSFIQGQIRGELSNLLEDPKGQNPAEAYVVLRESLVTESGAQAAAFRRKVIDGLVALTTRLCKLDCEKKEGFRAWLGETIKVKAERLSLVLVRTEEAAQRRYDEMVDQLLRDLRIFTAVNLAAFLLLGLAFWAVRERRSLIVLPIALLFPTTLFAIGLYLFGQNWFYTLVYDDYVGFGYLAYIGVTYVFLFDLCFLQGTITSMVVDAIKSIFQALAHCIPTP